MPDRESEPWESTAPGPFITISCAGGEVAVEGIATDRFRVTAPGREEIVEGFDQARHRAHELVQQRD